MGPDRTQHKTPDLLSAEGVGGQSSNAGADTTSTPPSPKSILSKDLPKALGYLDGQDLDRLLGAAIDETRRRGRLPPGQEVSSAKAAGALSEPIPKRSPPTKAPLANDKAKLFHNL